MSRAPANVLRLAMTGSSPRPGDDHGVYETLDLCLECRACKAEARGSRYGSLQERFLAGYWQSYGTPLHAKMLGNVHTIAKLGSPVASIMNRVVASGPMRHFNEALFGIDHRRTRLR